MQEKERMKEFVKAIKDTGLILEEPDQYKPLNPHADLHDVSKVPPAKPWEIVDQWKVSNKPLPPIAVDWYKAIYFTTLIKQQKLYIPSVTGWQNVILINK